MRHLLPGAGDHRTYLAVAGMYEEDAAFCEWIEHYFLEASCLMIARMQCVTQLTQVNLTQCKSLNFSAISSSVVLTGRYLS